MSRLSNIVEVMLEPVRGEPKFFKTHRGHLVARNYDGDLTYVVPYSWTHEAMTIPQNKLVQIVRDLCPD